MPTNFVDLPLELRLQIYRLAVGDRTIEVTQKRRRVKLYYWDFRASLSSVERGHFFGAFNFCICQAFSSAIGARALCKVALKTGSRSCTKHRSLLARSQYWREGVVILRPEMLDLNLLAVSRETRWEATRIMLATNRWSFDDAKTFSNWLVTVPPELLSRIHHIDFQMSFTTSLWDASSRPSGVAWSILSGDIASKLQKLQSLKIVFKFGEFLPFYKLSEGSEFTKTFQPLSQLRDLSVFSVRITDHVATSILICSQERHDGACHVVRGLRHQRDRQRMLWRQQEARRVWEEEIRDLVMNGTFETDRT